MTHQITTESQLRELFGHPVHELIDAKSSQSLSPSIKRFIALSPFATLATHNRSGDADVSPRGDAPGWVHIKDDNTLILPERPGNQRFDSVRNIINQPKLGLLFMIPGVLETVRVNGRGIISTDPGLLDLFNVNGKLPEMCIVVTVEETFGHCSKAYRRSRLWQDDYKPAEKPPTLPELMGDHLGLDEATKDMLDQGIEADARERLY